MRIYLVSLIILVFVPSLDSQTKTKWIDQSIIGVTFGDTISAQKILGVANIKSWQSLLVKRGIAHFKDYGFIIDSPFPEQKNDKEYCAVFLNNTKTEVIEFSIIPGGYGQLHNALVRAATPEDLSLGIVLEKMPRFVTEKNIRLGISYKRLLSILGKPSQLKTYPNGLVGVFYRDTDVDLFYSSEYYFINNRLIRFYFGNGEV